MKQMLFLCVAHAIQLDCEWARRDVRLVPKKCMYDERKRAYRGKLKVLGRIAGQLLEMIYALLKQDAERLSQVPPGQTPPDPILYDPEIHRAPSQRGVPSAQKRSAPPKGDPSPRPRAMRMQPLPALTSPGGPRRVWGGGRPSLLELPKRSPYVLFCQP